MCISFCLMACHVALAQDLRATRTFSEITLDGILDEQAWTEAPVHSTFVQCYPLIGAAPTQRTELRIVYNDSYLYVGVLALDSLPSRIIATGRERDIYYGSDDNICLTIDTYHDQRQGILFSSNPLGARFDEEVFDNGNGFNASFNTFWNVKSTRTDHGYSMEFQIPFSSLRFQAAPEVVMGIKLVRYIKHANEYDIFPASDATVANAVWRVNNTASIAFTDLRSRKPFYLIPYVKTNVSEYQTWDPVTSTSLRNRELIHRNHFVNPPALDRLLSNVGLDIKYGLSKNFTLDITTNTDFAQAETDDRILNFSRFAINLPEKRNFFLESRDYLGYSTSSGALLFNSRSIGIGKGNIVPVIGGVRLTGKTNGLQLGLLDLQTMGIHTAGIDPQHVSVARVRKEVWGNGSFVGGFFSNRVSTSGNSFNNQVIALDAVRRFKDNQWSVAIHTGATIDARRLTESGMADLIVQRVKAIGYNHSSSVELAGRNFRPQVGFAPDSAYVLTTTSNGYIRKWRNQEKRNLYWFTHLFTHKYRTINATHESLYTELELGTSWNNGVNLVLTPLTGREFLPYDWNFRGDIVIPSSFYIYPGLKARYDSRQTGRVNYSTTVLLTGFYGGRRANLLLSGYYAINRNFRLTGKYEHNTFTFPSRFSAGSTPHFRSNLVAAGLVFTQSIYFSVKALVQYDDISKTIGGNFRIRFNPKEGTDLYIVYNPRINSIYADGERTVLDQQSLIIKFSKAIGL